MWTREPGLENLCSEHEHLPGAQVSETPETVLSLQQGRDCCLLGPGTLHHKQGAQVALWTLQSLQVRDLEGEGPLVAH